MLLKSSVVSIVNCTTGVQDIGLEWCENLDSKLYQAITAGKGGMHLCRRDLTYQDIVHGGLGMMSITEQYKINRVRVIAGIIEAGYRHEHRWQKAWAKDLLIKDMDRIDPLLSVVLELNNIMKEVGVQMLYKPETGEARWSSQRMKVSLGEDRIMKKIQAQHLVYGGGQRVQWLQQRETNLKVINWYEQVMGRVTNGTAGITVFRK